MEWTDADVKTIIKRCVYWPTMEIDEVPIPLYNYTDGYMKKAGMIPEYVKSAKRRGKYSPNCVKALCLGNDGCIKVMFDGTEMRSSYGVEGWRTIEDVALSIAMGRRKGIIGLLDFALLEKMNNLEEIYINKNLLVMAGMKMKVLEGTSAEALAATVLSEQFMQKMFGVSSIITEEFKRIATIGLGDINVSVNEIKGNWELVLNADRKPVLANRNWVAEEKVYKDDEKLYRYIRNYMKNNFGE